MSRTDKIFLFFIVLFVFAFFYFVVEEVKRMSEDQGMIKSECVKTDFWVIGNKGRVTRVYDCSLD
jgi:preprotein translocase subunit YajC